MDDELSAARRCGAVRKLLWPHGKRHKGFMHGKRWMGVALVLLVCALTVVGIAVFNGGGKTPPVEEEKANEGVLSLSDFFRVYADHMDIQSAGLAHSLSERLMSEPFEVSAQMTIESEALKSLGIPLTSLPAEMDIKYDLRDAGVKVSAIGLDVFQAYITENELITVSMDTEPTVTELPAGGDVLGDMTLENRIGAFVPLPSEDLLEKLLGVLAQSVPEDCTELQIGRAYSPKDGQEVNVTLIDTSLDDEALSKAAAAFAEQIKKDESLYKEAQALTTAMALTLGESDVTLEKLLEQLINKDYEAITVSWQVFRRDETPIGFAVRVTTRDAQVDLIRMAEFDGDESYERTQLLVDGIQVFSADAVTKDSAGEFSVQAMGTNGETVSVDGTFELERYTENSFHMTVDAEAAGKLLGDNVDTVHVVIDARIDVGNGLGMLKGSSSWQNILDQRK
jgi:hypothetical protein